MKPAPPYACEVRLLYVTGVTGKGVEGDPVRRVAALYTHDGRLVAELDPEDPAGGSSTDVLLSLADNP